MKLDTTTVEKFAERVRTLRLEKQLTQIEFARKLNVSKSTVGLWETGGRMPSIAMLMHIADFFNITTDYLLGRVDY